jgi:CRP-like cAMP-binding protein
MAQKPRNGFSAQKFLTHPGPGKTFQRWSPKHTVFSQGDKADAVYYIQAGKVKLTVLSTQGKEAVVGVLAAENFFGEQCLTGKLFVRLRQPCWKTRGSYVLLGRR